MNGRSIYEFDALVSNEGGLVDVDGVHGVPAPVFAWLESEALRIAELGEGSWIRLSQRRGKRAVQVTSYVGVLRAPNGFQIEVLPKVGKVIGGGMPLAAFGGPREIMRQLAPTGPVYQAGTLSGNPVATACGLATLKEIAKPGFWDSLSAKTQSLVDGLKDAAAKAGVPFSADCQGGMFGFFLLPELPQNYAKVMTSDSPKFNKLFHGLLDRGVYIAPALYEAGFVSAAHTDADIAATVKAASEVFATL